MQIEATVPDADDLVKGAGSLLHAGRPAAARPLLAALARLKPDADGLALLESGLREAEGRIPDAISVLDAALAAQPANAALLKRRAGLRHRRGDCRAAIDDAAAAVIAAPRDASAKALLGMLLTEQGEVPNARACLAEACAAEPDNADFRLGFSEAAERNGEIRLAASLLEEGIARSPGNSDLREAAIRLALRDEDPAGAERLAEAARGAGLANATILRLLGQAAAAQGRARDSARWLGEALRLAPADESLRHMAAAAGAVPAAERAPREFVKAQFEPVANMFARSAIAAGNRVPGLIRKAVLAHAQGRGGPVLDLGCGSGLSAVALSDLAVEPFVGVDLSGRMLAAAREWGLYAELVEADLIDFLADERRCFPLILAAEVLPWFGSLKPALASAQPRLARGGRFILSLETTSAEEAHGRGWVLGPKGSYAHSIAAFESAAVEAGFRLVHLAPDILRFEKGAAIAGLIAVLGRSDDAA